MNFKMVLIELPLFGKEIFEMFGSMTLEPEYAKTAAFFIKIGAAVRPILRLTSIDHAQHRQASGLSKYRDCAA